MRDSVLDLLFDMNPDIIEKTLIIPKKKKKIQVLKKLLKRIALLNQKKVIITISQVIV